MVVDKNDEDWNSAKSELKELLTQKRSVELKIQGIQSKVTTSIQKFRDAFLELSMFSNNDSAAFAKLRGVSCTVNCSAIRVRVTKLESIRLPCHYPVNLVL